MQRGVEVSHRHTCPHTHARPKTAQFYSINQCHFPFLGSCSPVPYSIILLTRSGFLPLMGKSIATLNRFHNQFFYHRSTKLLPGFGNRNTLKKGKEKEQRNVSSARSAIKRLSNVCIVVYAVNFSRLKFSSNFCLNLPGVCLKPTPTNDFPPDQIHPRT